GLEREHPLLLRDRAEAVLVDGVAGLDDGVADGRREVERLGDGAAPLVPPPLARRARRAGVGDVERGLGDLLVGEAELPGEAGLGSGRLQSGQRLRMRRWATTRLMA